jgi:hypothetical protein
MSRRGNLERLANVSTIVAGLLLSAALVKAFLPMPTSGRPPRIETIPGPGISLKDNLSDISWPSNTRTIVLALSTSSPYCSDSAEFYRRIDQARAKDVRSVAIFREPANIARQFLQERDIHVDDVRQKKFWYMTIDATPMLMVLDDTGTVTDAWQGELTPVEEDEVIAAIKQGPVEQAPTAQGPGAKTLYTPPVTPQYRREPVRIERITEAGRLVLPGRYVYGEPPGKPFKAGDEWIQNLAVVIKNRTAKKIASLGLLLVFPTDNSDIAGRNGGGQIAWSIDLGEVPANARIPVAPRALIPTGTGHPLNLGPGQEMTISLADWAPAIKAKIEELRAFSSVSACILSTGTAYFEDGMVWGGPSFEYSQPMYDRPVSGAWVPMDPGFFPGVLNPLSRVPSAKISLTPDTDED